MAFEYRDKDGDNELGAEASVWVGKEAGILHVGVYSGDMNGDSSSVYVPNHREALFKLASDIFAVLDATKDWPEGFDGFSFNFASAAHTGYEFGDEDYPPGTVHWYG
jgi:hypothetical protein